MGYTYRNNGQITDFWPEDTENVKYSTFYECNFGALIDLIKEYWPDADPWDVTIRHEKIHTSCLSDYTDFIVIERKV